MPVWIGTSGFQYKEWKGGFYPAELSTAKMLGYYAERFSSTESNYTFRSLPSEKTIMRWRDGTPREGGPDGSLVCWLFHGLRTMFDLSMRIVRHEKDAHATVRSDGFEAGGERLAQQRPCRARGRRT